MDFGGVTWIVAADGSRARFFEEKRRAGEVEALAAHEMAVAEEDRPRSHRHGASVHDRQGPGRHGAGERSIADETAQRFLRRVADHLERALGQRSYDQLVLMAPPRALGILKAELSPHVAALVLGAEARDCTREAAKEIRVRLRRLRMEALS